MGEDHDKMQAEASPRGGNSVRFGESGDERLLSKQQDLTLGPPVMSWMATPLGRTKYARAGWL